ncbi:NAD(P)-binding protein, partial [Aspergillus ibericus CBS 121593]
TAIITGANTGIGLSTARTLLHLHPRTLILACRNLPSASTARDTLLASYPSTKTNIITKHLDLSSYASVRSFTREITSEVENLDLLVLNAGSAFFADFQLGNEGRERTVQNMFLSNVLLLLGLLPLLEKSAGRVTWVGSRRAYEIITRSHPDTTFLNIESGSILDWFDREEGYDMMNRYGEVKFLCLAFFYELATRLQQRGGEGGGRVILNMICPGAVRTNLARNLPVWYRPLVWVFQKLVSRSAEEAGVLVVRAGVVVGGESHGVFFGDHEVERVHPFFESDEGKRVVKGIWQETMQEMKRVGVVP